MGEMPLSHFANSSILKRIPLYHQKLESFHLNLKYSYFPVKPKMDTKPNLISSDEEELDDGEDLSSNDSTIGIQHNDDHNQAGSSREFMSRDFFDKSIR